MPNNRVKIPSLEIETSDGRFSVALEADGEVTVHDIKSHRQYNLGGGVMPAVIRSLAKDVERMNRRIDAMRKNIRAIID